MTNLTLEGCVFQNFFYEMSSFIMLPILNSTFQQVRYNISIRNTVFSRFTNCGSLLSNYHHSTFYNFPPTFNANYLLPQYQYYGEHLQTSVNQHMQRRYMSYKSLSQAVVFDTSPFSRYNSNYNFTRQISLHDNMFINFNMLKRRHNDNNYTARNPPSFAKVQNETIRDLGLIVQLYDNFDESFLSIENNIFNDTQQEFIYQSGSGANIKTFHCQVVIPYVLQLTSSDIYSNLSEPFTQQTHLISVQKFRNSLIIIANNTFRNISLSGPVIHIQEKEKGFESAFIIANNSFDMIHGLINGNVINIIRDQFGNGLVTYPFPKYQDLINPASLQNNYGPQNSMYGGNILIAKNLFSNICGCQEVDVSVISVAAINNYGLYQQRNSVTNRCYPETIFNYNYLNESQYFKNISIQHPFLGQLKLLRTGVNITGNTYINVTLGSDRFQLLDITKGGLMKFQNVARISITNEYYENIGSVTGDYSSYLFNRIHYKTSSQGDLDFYKNQAPYFDEDPTFFLNVSSSLIIALTAAQIELGENHFNNIWQMDRYEALTSSTEIAAILYARCVRGNITIGSATGKPSIVENIKGYLNNQTLEGEGYKLNISLAKKNELVAQYGAGSPLFYFIKENVLDNLIFQNFELRNMYFASNISYPLGEEFRIPAIFSTHFRDSNYDNVIPNVLIKDIYMHDVQFDGASRYFDILARNITIQNVILKSIGHLDLADDPRIRSLVLRDRITNSYRDGSSLFKLFLYSKDPSNGLQTFATQVYIKQVDFQEINHTRGPFPVFIVERPFDNVPSLLSKIEISNLIINGGFFDETLSPSEWGTEIPEASIARFSLQKAAHIDLIIDTCTLSWLFSTSKANYEFNYNRWDDKDSVQDQHLQREELPNSLSWRAECFHSISSCQLSQQLCHRLITNLR
ncbi:hypothetical protein FGO68_gene1764 [Halteria grandinella]|uniref:Uncharacterized protein n=1 Tax=Halteria grandinella TaxID=5974 RepID=A0A8J8TA22_HALGN|nr:hypothetical protein FGO68_gene1764 [Halteria grandinella]